MRGYLRVVVARVVDPDCCKTSAGFDAHQSTGSFLPEDQRELGRDMRAGVIRNDANRVILGRPGCWRRPGVDMTVRCAGNRFAAAKLAEELRLIFARLGIKLNRHFICRDLAKIHRHREPPSPVVAGETGFSQVKARPMLLQVKLPTPHCTRRFAPVSRAAANFACSAQVILLDIVVCHPTAAVGWGQQGHAASHALEPAPRQSCLITSIKFRDDLMLEDRIQRFGIFCIALLCRVLLAVVDRPAEVPAHKPHPTSRRARIG